MSHLGVEHMPVRGILMWLLRERQPVAELDSETGERRLTYNRKFLWTATIVVILANGAFGFMLALRVPRHPVGWLLLGAGALFQLSFAAGAYGWAAL